LTLPRLTSGIQAPDDVLVSLSMPYNKQQRTRTFENTEKELVK